MTKVDYKLTGCANGHPVRIEGKGVLTRNGAVIAFAAVEAPSTFDPGLARFAGIDAVVALAEGLALPHDSLAIVRSRAEFVTEGGVEVGTLLAVATIRKSRGGYRCVAEIAETRVAMEVGERIGEANGRSMHSSALDTGLALFSAGTVCTSRGNAWTVLVTTMMIGCERGKRRKVTIQAKRSRRALES